MVQRASYPISRNGAAMFVIRSVTSLFGLKRGICRQGGAGNFVHPFHSEGDEIDNTTREDARMAAAI